MTSYDAELQVTAVVRVEVTSGRASLDAVASLHRLPSHSRVIVDVGDAEHAEDPRVLEFLAEHARDRCLHLEVHGTLDAAAWWANELRRRRPPRDDPRRHLSPVNGGDPA